MNKNKYLCTLKMSITNKDVDYGYKKDHKCTGSDRFGTD